MQWPHSSIRNVGWNYTGRLPTSKSEVWDEVREKNGLKKPEKLEDLRRMDQRLASLEQNARQPRLAIEADVPADEKTRERTEGAA